METTEIIAELRKVLAVGDSPVFCGGTFIPKQLAMEAADRLEYLNGLVSEWEAVVHGQTYEPVVHAHWVIEKRHSVSQNPYMDDNYHAHATCSNCGFVVDSRNLSFGYADLKTTKFCSECGAHMDEQLELRTCYCPICDKHFEVRSNDSMGSCPDCGHHVVLHVPEVWHER